MVTRRCDLNHPYNDIYATKDSIVTKKKHTQHTHTQLLISKLSPVVNGSSLEGIIESLVINWVICGGPCL